MDSGSWTGMGSPRFDLLLKGGHLVDPGQGIDGVRDIAIDGNWIGAVDHRIPEALAARVVDLAGRVVTPGLIDVHTHLFASMKNRGIDPDEACLRNGVTTCVDAGTAGSTTFAALKALLATRRCRTYAFVHLSRIGMVGMARYVANQVGELSNLLYADPDGAIEAIQENRDFALGVKVRLSEQHVEKLGPIALWITARVARETGSRAMVHIGDATMGLPEIVAQLSPGDVVSHCYTPRARGALDARKRLIPEVAQAAERGILFDVAHGRTSFSFSVARAALEQGFLPHTISTDLSPFTRPVVRDLPTTMSKFLELGLSLYQVVERTTVNAARTLGYEADLGSLRPGLVADVAAFEIEEGRFEFVDSYGDTLVGRRRLQPVLTVLGGDVVYEAAVPPA